MTVFILVGGTVLVCAVVFVAAFQYVVRSDSYPPAAAEAPVERAYAEHGDTFGYERAALVTGDYPTICAGQDLDNAVLIGEIQQAIAAHRRGEDVTVGAPKELV
jgi:hypothetical protein